MATAEEVVTYVNGIITAQDILGITWVKGNGNVIIRIQGEYTDTQLNHLVSQYTEITDYKVRGGIGWLDIEYTYVAP